MLPKVQKYLSSAILNCGKLGLTRKLTCTLYLSNLTLDRSCEGPPARAEQPVSHYARRSATSSTVNEVGDKLKLLDAAPVVRDAGATLSIEATTDLA